MDKTQMGFLINQVYSKIADPIQMYLKSQRIAALAKAAEGAKDTPAGHRVFLRAMTMLEVELGIMNEENSEVQEGFISSVQELFAPKKSSSSSNLKPLKKDTEKQQNETNSKETEEKDFSAQELIVDQTSDTKVETKS